MSDLPLFQDPTVRGEPIIILGHKPEGYKGLGHRDGDILVLYPDGEKGCVNLSDIQEGRLPAYPIRPTDDPCVVCGEPIQPSQLYAPGPRHFGCRV